MKTLNTFLYIQKFDKYTFYKLILTLYKNKNRLKRYAIKLLPDNRKAFKLTYKTLC